MKVATSKPLSPRERKDPVTWLGGGTSRATGYECMRPCLFHSLIRGGKSPHEPGPCSGPADADRSADENRVSGLSHPTFVPRAVRTGTNLFSPPQRQGPDFDAMAPGATASSAALVAGSSSSASRRGQMAHDARHGPGVSSLGGVKAHDEQRLGCHVARSHRGHHRGTSSRKTTTRSSPAKSVSQGSGSPHGASRSWPSPLPSAISCCRSRMHCGPSLDRRGGGIGLG